MEHNCSVPFIHPAILIAALLALAPYMAAAFFPDRASGCARRLPGWGQILLPSLLCAPYALVAMYMGAFTWAWLAAYAMLPVAIAGFLWLANRGRAFWQGGWPELLILAALGVAVDLRWLEHAWPAGLSVFNKVLLLDAGIYGLVALRPVQGAGFDLRLRLRDVAFGLREFAFYLPVALALGLGLGFLHRHGLGIEGGIGATGVLAARFAAAWIFTFFFIAVPEELFFRGWVQNLLERRIGRWPALVVTAILFGLAHFNKRAAHFNWRYVLLAAIAGVFYGRAWRRERRIGASAITHATVDSIWSLWFR